MSDGAAPTATDCLFILRASIGSAVCEPSCICDANGSASTTATDALVCLKFAVGQAVELACPCPVVTTTTLPTATTTTMAVTTTTLSTTTTTLTDSFTEASPARVARLDAVLDAAVTILDEGGTYTDVADMLAGEPDVEGVSSNGVSMFFSVAGLPTTIYDGITARLGGELHEVFPLPASTTAGANAEPSLEHLRADSHLASVPIPGGQIEPVLPVGQRMVGEDDDGDGFRDMPKHALILAPYAWQFTTHDAAPAVRDVVQGVHDFQQGSVTYIENDDDLTIDTMPLSAYMNGWGTKDLIFISTHGDADANALWGPDSYLSLGIGGATCAALAAKAALSVPDAASRPGLHCSVTQVRIGGTSSSPVWGRSLIAARQFWEHVHGGKLKKKVIWIDACRPTFTPGLAEAFTGQDSVFFGWDEYVQSDHSKAVATRMITEMTMNAFPALRSFERECADGSCIEAPVMSQAPNGYDGTKFSELKAGWARGDLRLRDSLTIPAEPMRGFCAVSPEFPVSTTCPSCGGVQPMAMIYDATLEGIDASELVLREDAYEFATEQLRLFADKDEVESGFALPLWNMNMTDLGGGAYAVTDFGGFGAVTLYVDDVCPNDIFEYNPWVLLPAFDPARPGNDDRDRIYSWDGPFLIEVIPDVF